jgi:hypothetical protein
MHLCRDWPCTRIKQEWNNVHQFRIHRFSVLCSFSYITGLYTRVLRISHCCIFNHPNKNKKFWQELFTYFPLVRHAPHKNDAFNNYSIGACVFVAAVTSLPSRCLATVGDTHTDWWEGFMTYAVEMDSGAMAYIQSFIKTSSDILKLIWRGEVHWRTVWSSYKPTFFFSK